MSTTSPEIDQKTRLKVPDAPKDLFIQIAAAIRRKPDRLKMSYWHYNFSDDYLPVDSHAIKEKDCNTAHCLAGWVTFLTPGGLRLEGALTRRKDIYKDDEFTSYVRSSQGSPVAVAALLILEKAGWSERVFASEFYKISDERARRLIFKLAKIERDRLRRVKAKRLKKAA